MSKVNSTRKEKYKPATRENIEEALTQIGWSLNDRGCNMYLFENHEGGLTDLWYYKSNKPIQDEIFIESSTVFPKTKEGWGGKVCFVIKDLGVRIIKGDTVCIGTINGPDAFILLSGVKQKKGCEKDAI